METQNHRRSRQAGRAALIGTALTVALVAPLAGSAALDSGSFFIYAYNDQEPEINARAGLKGVVKGGNPGGPGTENPVATTVACGDESMTVTQEMLDFSDRNREAVSSGGTAETWPGSDWKFITVGSFWKDVSGSDVPAGISVEKDRSYMFSSEPTGGAFPQLVSQELPLLRDQFTGVAASDMNSAAFTEAQGSNPSVIGQSVLSADGVTYRICSYSKFENGKISSSDGSPAFYYESVDNSKRSLYLKDGLPAFGSDRASYIIEQVDGSTVESFYLPSNGERWDYHATKSSLWHPDRQVSRSNSGSVVGETRWTNCFGDSCEVKVENPTVAVTETKLNDGTDAVRMKNYLAPRVIHGADSIMVKYRENGSIAEAEYSNTAVPQGEPLRWKFSRTDGPATFSEDESGGVYSRSYYVDGYAKQNQSQYESAGGTGWLGMYSGGREIHYLGD